jgi:hypothetical protein
MNADLYNKALEHIKTARKKLDRVERLNPYKADTTDIICAQATITAALRELDGVENTLVEIFNDKEAEC